ncbi:hypothetical protein GQ53DRAFT_751394 [Thozetella sp. PMI_491]|nr:hypothetical protein GQ53DRAFT_751394 [Thozetella sp. PMI_491]
MGVSPSSSLLPSFYSSSCPAFPLRLALAAPLRLEAHTKLPCEWPEKNTPHRRGDPYPDSTTLPYLSLSRSRPRRALKRNSVGSAWARCVSSTVPPAGTVQRHGRRPSRGCITSSSDSVTNGI